MAYCIKLLPEEKGIWENLKTLANIIFPLTLAKKKRKKEKKKKKSFCPVKVLRNRAHKLPLTDLELYINCRTIIHML